MIDKSEMYVHQPEADTCGDPTCCPPLESIQTFIRNAPKIGRNDPCPCDSGRKFKKCCGAKG
ncbi:MAG: SEC-C metal-binding domain-containing protein [Pseudomonadota bacterium]